VRSLLAGATLTIDGRAGNRVGPTRCENRVASDVQGLLANLHHASHDDVIDASWVDTRALDEGVHHLGCKINWVPVLEASVALAQWTADCVDDYCGGHD
jgi:hypothetical protein